MFTKVQILKSSNILMFAAILVAGVMIFSSMVTADNATTAVTVGNAVPAISSISLNGGSDITLTEDSYTWATSTMTVSDSNGCSSISSVTATLYYAESNTAGTLCSQDDNNCYVSTCSVNSANACSGGSDTSAQYDCGFKIWYNATPTDTIGQIWAVSATTTDGVDTSSATNTTETIEINTLNALALSGNIAYPQTSANSNTGATNQTITIENTGNAIIDGQFSSTGDNMCTDFPTCSGESFATSNQKYDTSDVTYTSLTNSLSSTATTRQLDIAKPTSTTTPSTVNTYWGIAIPDGQPAGSYTGENVIGAVTNI